MAHCPARKLVSTHSRPKAAGPICPNAIQVTICFNTQPPEGGWRLAYEYYGKSSGFNTQPPEGGWSAVG